ncbi:hypothetical protein EHV15_01610 [Paenibacillus oralis]|uniref:Sporulation protein YjcZ n=1 Tax=Paenibacillus oralis TaxID=2490856 RepID=A0A3P3TZX7_9BACL|nr:hypothetical protein EHV15_01610 [Paenibacillus oralis]
MSSLNNVWPGAVGPANVGPANVGPVNVAPVNVAPVHVAPVYVAPVHRFHGFWTSTGTILVLYILLVIILRSTVF